VTIVRQGVPLPAPAPGELVVPFDEFVAWIRRGRVLAHVGRHARGRLLVNRLETAGRPLPLGLALRVMSRGSVEVEDLRGRRRALTAGLLARWTAQVATEPFRVAALLRQVARALDAIDAEPGAAPTTVDFAASPVYLRTDLSFGVRAGGSVAHIAGVVNELDHFTGPITVLTTDDIPTLSRRARVHQVAPAEAFWNFRELPTLLLNDAFDAARRRDRTSRRSSTRDTVSTTTQAFELRAGIACRSSSSNGSEIWMGRHWGHALKHEALSRRIEQLNLSAATLIVVVSRAMRDEIVARGIPPGPCSSTRTASTRIVIGRTSTAPRFGHATDSTDVWWSASSGRSVRGTARRCSPAHS
jgi:hypothetical protein